MARGVEGWRGGGVEAVPAGPSPSLSAVPRCRANKVFTSAVKSRASGLRSIGFLANGSVV